MDQKVKWKEGRRSNVANGTEGIDDESSTPDGPRGAGGLLGNKNTF